MQKKEFIILPNNKNLELYTKYNFKSFILPLKDFSIGYDVYFDIDEINKLSNDYEIYVIMNKFLHMNIYEFEKIYNKFNKSIKFIVEDIGLVNIIDKDRLILYENHILSNYKAINYLNSLDIKNVVINNDLTIDELKEIIDKTKSNIYYFYTCKNILMYSRRNLVSNFNKYYDLEDKDNYLLSEIVTHKELEIKEEKDGSIVRNHRIFCASKYLKELNIFNLIVDLTDINEVNTEMILNNIKEENLCDLIDSDYYFLENPIKYKVGDLK
ncbi:MAG: U32 family peptidase [Bacilli bacterium]|nr:U32 family peptidase [Bacilli bacterium]